MLTELLWALQSAKERTARPPCAGSQSRSVRCSRLAQSGPSRLHCLPWALGFIELLSFLIHLPKCPAFQTSTEKGVLPMMTWHMVMTPIKGVLPTPTFWMLCGLHPKTLDKMATSFNLSFLFLPPIQSILLSISDSTGERKVFENSFYDLKGEIYWSKWQAIALCFLGTAHHRKGMRGRWHTWELYWVSRRLDW